MIAYEGVEYGMGPSDGGKFGNEQNIIKSSHAIYKGGKQKVVNSKRIGIVTSCLKVVLVECFRECECEVSETGTYQLLESIAV